MTKQNELQQTQFPLTIVGIDPGSYNTGFACIGSRHKKPMQASHFEILDLATLEAPKKLSSNQRLSLLHKTIFQLLEKHRPHYVVLEKAFFGVNAQSALKLGQIRGSYIAAAGRLDIEIAEISPNSVKKIIAGKGHASKEEISFCLQALMNFSAKGLSFDATDALGIALSFALSTLQQAKPIQKLKEKTLLKKLKQQEIK